MKCTSKDNSLSFLKRKGYISETRRLQIEPIEFEKINKSLTEFAKKHYKFDLDQDFYTVETQKVKTLSGHNYHRDNYVEINRVIPNEEAFNRLDELRHDQAKDDKSFAPIDYFEDENVNYETIIPNYEKYILYKKGLVRRLNNRLSKISSQKKKFASDKKTLKELTRLESEINKRIKGEEALNVRGLLDEISELENNPNVDKIEYYSEKDFQRLEKLSTSENPEDLHEARTIISFYTALGTFDVTKSHPMFLNEEMFDIEGNLSLDKMVVQTLSDLRDKAIRFENIITQKEKSSLVNTVNSNSKVKETFNGKEFDYQALFYKENGLKDTPWMDMFLMDITNGIFSQNGIVPQVMMNTIQNSFERNKVYAKSIENRVEKIQIEVEKELARLGYKISIPGVRGVSYDLFRAVDENGQFKDSITQRYSSHFIDERNKMFYEFNEIQERARATEDPHEKSTLFKEAFSKRDNWYKKNTIVLDIRKIPEINEDPIFDKFSSEFIKSEGYKKELIDILGEQGYKEEVDKQIKLLKDYITMYEVSLEELLMRDKVEDIKELSKEAKTELEVWVKRNNPFDMMKGYYDNEALIVGNTVINSNMTYNYSVPRRKKVTIRLTEEGLEQSETKEDTGYYDQRFETIESNESLKEFHNILMELNQKMFDVMPEDVRKKFSSYSIPVLKKNLMEILFDKNTPLYQRLSEAYRYIIDKIRGYFGMNPEDNLSYTTVDPITGKPEYKINDSFLKGNKETISNRHFVELQRLKKALGIPATQRIGKYDKFDITKNSEVIRILAENLGVENSLSAIQKKLPNEDLYSLELSKVLQSAITDQVVQENSFDLPKIMKLFSYMTMEYAARQEVLPIIEMMKKHYEDIKAPHTNNLGQTVVNAETNETRLEGERKNAIKQMDSWFERVVLGYYGSKNELGDTRIKRQAKLGLTGNEKIDSLTSKMHTNITGRILDTDEKLIKKKIGSLKQELIDLSQSEDVDEVKIASNILSKMSNIEEGLGKHFTVTSFFEALFNFIRLKGLGWNLSSYVTNFAEGQVANITIAASGDYFTPENIYRANDIVKGSFLKNMTFGKVATDGSKKVRVLMDRYRILQDASNELQKASTKSAFSNFQKVSPYEGTKRVEYLNQAPLMVAILLDIHIVGKNGETSNVFDAMNSEGELKEEFKTVENIKNWEDADGDKYNDFSSKVKKTIVNTHGDNDELRGNYASERISGKAMLMFRRWMARQFYQRFAYIPQADIEVGIEEYKGRYFSHTSTSGLLHGAIIGFGGLGLLGAGPLGIALGGAVGFGLGKFYGANTGMGFLQEMALTGKELFLNMARIPINNLTGKNIIKTDKFNAAISSTELSSRDVRNLRANLTDMSILLFWTAMILFTKALLWDDDDEEDDTRRIAHNLLANRFIQLSSQSAMYANPQEAWKNSFGDISILKFFGDVGKTAVAAEELLEGKDTYSSGPNAGESKFLNQASKTFLPGILKPGYGFDSQAQRQFKETAFDSWFFSDEKIAKTKTRELRAIYRSELEEKGLEPEVLEEVVNLKYRPKKKEESYSELLKEYQNR